MKSLDREIKLNSAMQSNQNSRLLSRKVKPEEIKIVYLDNHLLIALKPAGLLTQPNGLENIASLEEEMKAYLKEKFQKPGRVFLHAVQRLDKSVSGLVLFARTSKALSRLNAQMRNKAVKKQYLALVEGRVAQKEGRLENFLFHANHCAKVVTKEHSQAKKALLHFKVLKEISNKRSNQSLLEKDQSLLKIELLTGRYHQIRAQLAHLGHPIVGDAKYGSQTDLAAIKLHACQLDLVHPVTKASLSFFEAAAF